MNLINEAVRYINELQEQVIQKLNIDPQLIQQKILEEFSQINSSSQNNSPNVSTTNLSSNASSSVSSSNSTSDLLNNLNSDSSSNSTQLSLQVNSSTRSRESKINRNLINSRRTPLEEINLQKSIKRQRI